MIRTLLIIVFGIALLYPAGPAPAQALKDLEPGEQAVVLWRQGYALHELQRYEDAALFYRLSIRIHPTAQAHTFLGWSLKYLGRLPEAIAECKKAISLDPDFGNPYNDIGVYLIDLGRPEEAVPWFEKAIAAKHYCCYQFAHFNLGRVFLNQGKIKAAKRAFERALSFDPGYTPAKVGLKAIVAYERRTL